MPALPAHPSLDHLRREAKRLLRDARSGDAQATGKILAVSAELTLSAAQLAVARSYGFASWPQLKAEVEARTLSLEEKVREFCVASVGDWTGRAVRLLAETPELAEAGFATAVLLGDVARVRAELERDPGLAGRVDPHSGWTPLHLVCGSRWHWLQPRRADGLVQVARVLLDAGADLGVRTEPRPRRGARTPLGCATSSASVGVANLPLLELLLERGAVPDDHDLYMVGFAGNAAQALGLLVKHMPDVAGSARMALAAPISKRDTESVRVLLEAGADPRRYHDDDGRPAAVLHAAIECRCPAELVELLLAHGADPNESDEGGRSAYRAATTAGRDDLVQLLLASGGRDDTTPSDRLLSGCLHADKATVRRELASNPGLLDRPEEVLGPVALQAAESGLAAAVELMLDLGFPINATAGDDGGTLLHAAAYAGSAQVVKLLADRGADIEARDARWESTALEWAAVGSGERPTTNPGPDWTAVVQVLLDSGASTDGVGLDPDEPKPPSRDVANLIRSRS